MDQSGFVTKNNGGLAKFRAGKFRELSCSPQRGSYVEVSTTIQLDQWDAFLKQLRSSGHSCVKLSCNDLSSSMIKQFIEKTEVSIVYSNLAPLLNKMLSVARPLMLSIVELQQEWSEEDWLTNLDDFYCHHIQPVITLVERVRYENEQDYRVLKDSLSFVVRYLRLRLMALQKQLGCDSEFFGLQSQLADKVFSSWHGLFANQDKTYVAEYYAKVFRESILHGQDRDRIFQQVEDVVGLTMPEKKISLRAVELWEVAACVRMIGDGLTIKVPNEIDMYYHQASSVYEAFFERVYKSLTLIEFSHKACMGEEDMSNEISDFFNTLIGVFSSQVIAQWRSHEYHDLCSALTQYIWWRRWRVHADELALNPPSFVKGKSLEEIKDEFYGMIARFPHKLFAKYLQKRVQMVFLQLEEFEKEDPLEASHSESNSFSSPTKILQRAASWVATPWQLWRNSRATSLLFSSSPKLARSGSRGSSRRGAVVSETQDCSVDRHAIQPDARRSMASAEMSNGMVPPPAPPLPASLQAPSSHQVQVNKSAVTAKSNGMAPPPAPPLPASLQTPSSHQMRVNKSAATTKSNGMAPPPAPPLPASLQTPSSHQMQVNKSAATTKSNGMAPPPPPPPLPPVAGIANATQGALKKEATTIVHSDETEALHDAQLVQAQSRKNAGSGTAGFSSLQDELAQRFTGASVSPPSFFSNHKPSPLVGNKLSKAQASHDAPLTFQSELAMRINQRVQVSEGGGMQDLAEDNKKVPVVKDSSHETDNKPLSFAEELASRLRGINHG